MDQVRILVSLFCKRVFLGDVVAVILQATDQIRLTKGPLTVDRGVPLMVFLV